MSPSQVVPAPNVPASIAAAFMAADVDKDGKLDFTEFCQFVRDREEGEFTEEELRKREAIRRSLIRVAKRELSKGWNEWLEMWQESLQLRAFMRRMMSSEVSKGWNSWLESWEESIRKRLSLIHI